MRLQVFGLILIILALVQVFAISTSSTSENNYEACRSKEDYAHPVCPGT